MTTPIRAISAAAVAVSVWLGGCGDGEVSRHATTENATSKVTRHDLEPLTKRFPEIGTPISATWMSGTVGTQSDSRATVPGPSVYWIEAIIELEPTTADTLRSKYAPTATGVTPNLNDNLRTEIPAGTFLTSPALDTALSNNDWRSTAYLHSSSNTLVMRSVDD
ncbi:hypothetical protein [Mycolicibacterium septicum]|uniref:hypothetical protein n=1 Tax=Mycolicibacterium septicum TaxID=98668 RepID=UPI001AF5395E|nr:hypothetical protein [Mycolicibacterium septicum]QRY52217.1 hypothetical protein JVX95_02110 [Mycolicibacterium septicum]